MKNKKDNNTANNPLADKAEILINLTNVYPKVPEANKQMFDYPYLSSKFANYLSSFERKIENGLWNDKEVKRKDSLLYLKKHLDILLNNFSEIKLLDSNIKNKLYNIVFNTTISVYNKCSLMRTSYYSIHATKYLAWIISSLESNVVLSSLKYTKWRVKIYVELALCYEDIKAYKSSLKVISYAIVKLNSLRDIEELQYKKNLPDYVNTILVSNFRYLKWFEIKYSVISGVFSIDSWKKKLDEAFVVSNINPEEKLSKIISMLISVSNSSFYNKELIHEGLTNNSTSGNSNFNKLSMTQYIVEYVKQDVSNIKRGLEELLERKKRNIEKEAKIKENFKNFQKILNEYSKEDDNMLKPSIFESSSKVFPIELHFELIKCCFDCKLNKEFEFLSDSLFTRIKLRSIEVPFLSEIDIQVSPIEHGNIPNRFDKIQIDLNVNNYLLELKKLRSKDTNTEGNNLHNIYNDIDKNNSKKNEKDILSKNIALENLDNEYNLNHISQINHMYVYLILKRSHNTENAIINVRVVFSNDVNINKEIEADERAVCVPIKTFEDKINFNPIKEKYKLKQKTESNIINFSNSESNSCESNFKRLTNDKSLYPYIVYKKTNNNLQNEEEKLKALVDLYPLVSNAEFADPVLLKENLFNFKKINAELTNKALYNYYNNKNNNINNNSSYYDFNHYYINLLEKTDENFFLIEREFKIYYQFYLLEQSYIESSFLTNENKSNVFETNALGSLDYPSLFINPTSQKFFNNNFVKSEKYSFAEIYLGIKFDFDYLETISSILFESIEGPLGCYFITNRTNFINELIEIIYKKYLKLVLLRIDYFFETDYNEYIENKNIYNVIDLNSKSLNKDLKIEEINKIFNFIVKIQASLLNICYNLSYVYTKIPVKIVDIVTFINLINRTADIAERTENYSKGCYIAHKALDILNSYKESNSTFNLRSIDYPLKHPFSNFTCDNNKIINLLEYTKDNISKKVRDLNFNRRKKYREVKSITALKEGEALEEDFEEYDIEKEYEKKIIEIKKKEIIDPSSFNSENNKVINKLYSDLKSFSTLHVHSEAENNINCLITDLYIKYFRLYIKDEQFLLKDKTNTNNKNNLKKQNSLKPIDKSLLNKNVSVNQNNRHLKVPDRVLKELNIVNSPSSVKTKESLNYLKSSLQEAKKLDADRPALTKKDKDMIKIVIKQNPYLNSLYSMVLASIKYCDFDSNNHKKNIQDKKYLLSQSYKYIKEAYNEESEREQYYKKYYFEIYACLNYNRITEKNLSNYYPYMLLNKYLMIDYPKINNNASNCLPEPILINKTQNSATFMTPIYKLKSDGNKDIIKYTKKSAIFGQVSTGSNIVKINNNKLLNTGIARDSSKLFTISNLNNNEKYIFAYAGYDDEGIIINDIGATSKQVEAYFPLPLYLISSKLAKACYDYDQFEMCIDITRSIFSEITIMSSNDNFYNFIDINLDNKINNLFLYKLNYTKLRNISILEQEGIATCFYILAKCIVNLSESNYNINYFDSNIISIDNKSKSKCCLLNKQKNILKNINIISLALKISINIRNYGCIQQYSTELYNSIVKLIKYNNNSHNNSSGYIEFSSNYLNQILILIHSGLLIIPNQLINKNYRILLCKVIYLIVISYCINNINKGSNSAIENNLIKKVLSLDSFNYSYNKKKYYLFFYNYLSNLEEETSGKNKTKNNTTSNKKNTKKDLKKVSNKENIIASDNNNNKPSLFPAIMIKELEKENLELEEFILSIGNFNNIMKQRLQSNINILDNLSNTFFTESNSKYINDNLTSEIENKKKEINDNLVFWESFKSEGVKYFLKYLSTASNVNNNNNIISSNYYENSTKLLKLINENILVNKIHNTTLSNNTIVLKSLISEIMQSLNLLEVQNEDKFQIEEVFNQKRSFFNHDIVYSVKLRIKEYIDNLENNLLVENTLTENHDLNEISNQEIKNINNEFNFNKIKQEIEEKYFNNIVVNEEKTISFKLYANNNDVNKYYSLKDNFFWIGEYYLQAVFTMFYNYILECSYFSIKENNIYTNYENCLNLTNYNVLNFNYFSCSLDYTINNFLNYSLCDYNKISLISKEIHEIENELRKSKPNLFNKDSTERNSILLGIINELNKTNQDFNKQKNQGTTANNKDKKMNIIKGQSNTENEKEFDLDKEENLIINNYKDSTVLLDFKFLFNNCDYISSNNKHNIKYNENTFIFNKQLISKMFKLSSIFETASKCALYLQESNSYLSIDNLIYLLHNIVNYDMINPFDVSNFDINLYLNTICQVALIRLTKVKEMNLDNLNDSNYYERELNLLRVRIEEKGSVFKPNATNNSFNPKISKHITYGDNIDLNNNNNNKNIEQVKNNNSKLEIELFKNSINLDAYIELLCFNVQSLYHSKKYNLLCDFIVKLNLITNNIISDYTVPFLIECQSKIHNKGREHSLNKKNDLNNRVKEFEHWKNSRKRNKRQLMITGETPTEQLEFERDYNILSKELEILESLEKLFSNDLQKSKDLLLSIENDSNNATKALKMCKKLYEKLQFETLKFKYFKHLDFNSFDNNDNHLLNEQNFVVKNKFNKLCLFTESVIETYNKGIKIFKKRQENYMLIIALYDLANVYESQAINYFKYKNKENNNLNNSKNLNNSNIDLSKSDYSKYFEKAELYLNEALDTIFQKLYSLKDFRTMLTFQYSYNFNKLISNCGVVEKYGLNELLLAVIILEKLSSNSYENNIHKQRECTIMSSEIVKHLLSASMPNPNYSNCLVYSTFKVLSINLNNNCYNNNTYIKPEQLLESLINISNCLIMHNLNEEMLPILALAEHLALDKVKSNLYLNKIRINKIQACANIGLIKEAYINLYKVIKKVDAVETNIFNNNKNNICNNINVLPNDGLAIGKYSNIPNEFLYDNSLSPENSVNQEVINNFNNSNKINIDSELKYSLGANLYCELVFSKCLILIKLCEKENLNNYLEKFDYRNDLFLRIDKDLRNIFEIVSTSEDLSLLTFIINKIKESGIQEFVVNNNNNNNNNDNKEIYNLKEVLSSRLLKVYNDINDGKISITEDTTISNTKQKKDKDKKKEANVNYNVDLKNNEIINESFNKNNLNDVFIFLLNKKIEQILNTKKITNSYEEINKFYLNGNSSYSTIGVFNYLRLRKARINTINRIRFMLSKINLIQSFYLQSTKILLKGICHLNRLNSFNLSTYYLNEMDNNDLIESKLEIYNSLDAYNTEININADNINQYLNEKLSNNNNQKQQNSKQESKNKDNKKITNNNFSNDVTTNLINNYNEANEIAKTFNNIEEYILFINKPFDYSINLILNQFVNSINTDENSDYRMFCGFRISNNCIDYLNYLILIANNYLQMNRLEDVKYLIVKSTYLCILFNDVFYNIRFREILIKLLIKENKTEKAKNVYFETLGLNNLSINKYLNIINNRKGVYYEIINKYLNEIVDYQEINNIKNNFNYIVNNKLDKTHVLEKIKIRNKNIKFNKLENLLINDENERINKFKLKDSLDYYSLLSVESLLLDIKKLDKKLNSLETDKRLNNSSVYIFEIDFIIFSFNFSEYLFKSDLKNLSIGIFSECRTILWKKLAFIGYYINELDTKYNLTNNEFNNVLTTDNSLKKFLLDGDSQNINLSSNKTDNKNNKTNKTTINDFNDDNIAKMNNNIFDCFIEKTHFDNNSNSIDNIIFKLSKYYCNENLINNYSYLDLSLLNKKVNTNISNYNIYFKYNDTLTKMELRYVYLLINKNLKVNTDILDNKTEYKVASETKDQSKITNKINENINNLISLISDKEIKSYYKILDDASVLSKKMLYSSNFNNISLLYLKSKLKYIEFCKQFNNFVKEKIFSLFNKKSIKLEIFNKDSLIAFTNYYSISVKNQWIPILEESFNYLEQALCLFENDNIYGEFEINLLTVINSSIDILQIICEFRPNINPKFIDIYNIVDKINKITKFDLYYDKEQDDLPTLYNDVIAPHLLKNNINLDNINYYDKTLETNKDTVSSDKNKKINNKNETKQNIKLDDFKKNTVNNTKDNIIDLHKESQTFINDRIRNDIQRQNYYVKLLIYYIELGNNIEQLFNYINNKTTELANGFSLIDISKIPKDVAMQIIESEYIELNKNINDCNLISNNLSIPTVDSFSILNFLKKKIKQLQFDNFSFNSNCNLIPFVNNNTSDCVYKIHKYLNNNLTSYSGKFNILNNNYTLQPSKKFNELKESKNINPINFDSCFFSWNNGSANGNKFNYSLEFIYNINLINDNITNGGNLYDKETIKSSKNSGSNNNINHLIYVLGPIKSGQPNYSYGRIPILESRRIAINNSFVDLRIKYKELLNYDETKRNREQLCLLDNYLNIVKLFSYEILRSVSFFDDFKKADPLINLNLIKNSFNLEILNLWTELTSGNNCAFNSESNINSNYNISNSTIVEMFKVINQFFTDLHNKIVSSKSYK